MLNAVPASLIKRAMKKTSKDAAMTVEKSGSTHALEAMYTRDHRRLFSRGFSQGVADIFWHHIVSQPKAIRNRLKIVREIIRTDIETLAQERKESGNSDPIRILSIAGGSARSIIQAVSEVKGHSPEVQIEVVVIDKDQSALNVGAKIAQEAGLSKNFTWIVGNANKVQELLPATTKFDLVEIVGLLDYFDDERALRLIGNAKADMNDGGFMVIANVLRNSETPFVHKMGWPAMIYRKPKEVEDLLSSAGFEKDLQYIVEPLRVHCVAVGRK